MTDDGANPPYLQQLVARFGRYDLIAPKAWQEYDAAIAQWRIDRIVAMGLRPISPAEMKERKRAKRAARNHASPPGAGLAVENENAPKIEGETNMDMSRYSGSSFLKPEHLADEPRIEIIAKVQDGSFDRPELIFESGDKLSLNITNTRIMCRAWGPNSDDWIGKSIELSAGTTEYKGEKVATIIIRPISPAMPKEAQRPLPEPRDLRDEMGDSIPF